MPNYTNIVSFLTTAIVVSGIFFVNFSVLFAEDFPASFIEISIYNNSANDIEVNENHEFDTEKEVISEQKNKTNSYLTRSKFSENQHSKKTKGVFTTILTPPPESC